MTSFANLDLSETYTYADYYSWRFEERLELIEGKIFKMSPAPSGSHQLIAGNIFSELHQFLKGKPFRVFPAPFDVRLVRSEESDKKVKTVVQPDACVVCDMAKIADPSSCPGAPDIVVETLSPGNNKKEIKLSTALRVIWRKGYWRVYPDEQSVIRYVLDDKGKFVTGRALTSGDKLVTPVLPGFELALDGVFSNLLDRYNEDEYTCISI